MNTVMTTDFTIEVKKSEPVIKKLIGLEVYTWKLDKQMDRHLGDDLKNKEPQFVKIR